MFSLPLLAFLLSVLLASHASILSTTGITNDVDATTTLKGISFIARATPNANKGSSDNHTLLNYANMEYTGKVNVGGHDFTLIIDTGSSDLWVTSGSKLKLNSSTNTTVNLTYGIGSAYGTIAYAPVSFAGFDIDNQAFLSVTKTYEQDTEGILGLGLNGLSVLERTTKNSSAQSVVANVFAQHSSTPHLIGLALERAEGGENTAGGYLTIGEYDARYVNVTQTPKIQVVPSPGTRWTIPMEAMTIDTHRVPLKSGVKGASKGEAIALIDSGTSLAYIPADAVDALYSQFNKSVHVKTADEDAWFVPCLAQVNLSFTFGHIPYPINPMELSTPVRVVQGENQYTVCIGTFRAPLHGDTSHDFDFLLGDIFMRNVYTVFNFANQSLDKPPPQGQHVNSPPTTDGRAASIQFLSRTNRDQVYANFQEHRRNALAVWPPLFDLSKLKSDGTTEGGGRLAPSPNDA